MFGQVLNNNSKTCRYLKNENYIISKNILKMI